MSENYEPCDKCGNVKLLSDECSQCREQGLITNTPASDHPEKCPKCGSPHCECFLEAEGQPDRGNHIYQEVSGDGYECFMEDQPKYRPLAVDEVIQEGDIYNTSSASWRCDHTHIGRRAKTWPYSVFLRPIAAEKREEGHAGDCSIYAADSTVCDCGFLLRENSKDPGGQYAEQWVKHLAGVGAQAQISTLQQQLAQEKEAKRQLLRELAQSSPHLPRIIADRDNLREALRPFAAFGELVHGSVNDINVVAVTEYYNHFTTADRCVRIADFRAARAALQQSEGKC